jgi:hypothetical protein
MAEIVASRSIMISLHVAVVAPLGCLAQDTKHDAPGMRRTLIGKENASRRLARTLERVAFSFAFETPV